ncbi:carboxypeptidase regulatory-like domain-containing protein [Silvibacterium sp.]|uniref:carboxypeptidase regulatory-like domain-containing protein n=1 Tax=Silvibacterium sp. TaxID=1964179 RepID=UPI0039E284DD
MTRRCCTVLSLLMLMLTAVSAFAQNATTSLRGVVKDPSGAVVPNATITLKNAATGYTTTATSNGTGEYQLQQIPPAKYTITVSASGFGDQSKAAELLVNQPATINFALGLQSSNVVVNVSGEAETLNTTDASLGNSMNNTTIQALPSETRNVPDLLSLQPGVLYLGPSASNSLTADSRSGSVNGGRSDQGNITLDGVDDNDQVNGFAFQGVLRETQDSVEEFRVTTGGANSDEGRSSGAQVSLMTKAGTNKFHGAAYEYYRPTNTVSNDWFNKQAELESGEPNIPGKLLRNIFGADLGGPIFKDKLFFFGNYEGERISENAQVTQEDPTSSYQQGLLTYLSGGNAVTLTQAQVAALDSGCTANGVCPWGPGADPYALKYFQAMPAANGFTEGDGYNSGSYSFSSPNPTSLNTMIAKIDFTPGQRHRIFVRGNLQKDTTDATEQFPGQGPNSVLVQNNKGITAGDTWTITPNLVNDVRYGYIRAGYGNAGVGNQNYVDFRFLSTETAETRSTIASTPVNNIVDNLSWAKGKHNLQFGGNWRLVHQNFSTDANSFDSGSSNPYWLGGTPPGYASVDSGFQNSYEIAYANLIGTIPDVTDNYNYDITSPTSGSLLADGAFVNRHYKANEYEYYLQDSWRVLPNLTLTFGVRHSILQTPWETSGQQVAPTIDTHAWYQQREAAALSGQVYEPNLEFAPTGPYYNKPGYWPKSKNNFAPRFALAYSPDGKTSIRLGAGIYYDHFGEALVNTFAQEGSFGVSSAITNPAGTYSYTTAPRFTGRNTLPFSNGSAPTTTSFPYTPPAGPSDGFAITWGLDDKIKTPYSEALDLSVQRQLPGGWTVETAYVGRLGRHLLASLDLAEPVDFVDPQGAGDYYSAGSKLSHLVDLNGGSASATVPTIQYFEDMFPFMAGYDYPGESATQAIYTNEWAPYRANLGATTALSDIDFYCYYNCPAGYQSHFWQQQFSSLYALSSIGMSYYNAGQITLRHPMSHGLQADISYTYSRSIDMSSNAERNSEFGGNGSDASSIINTWKPYLNRGVSDFDTTHLLTVDWVYLLPFGQGKWLGGNSGTLLNTFIGGWQFSGIARATSGLPFSLFEPGWTTDWQIESYAVTTAKVKIRRHFDQNGEPQFFDDPDAINNGVANGSPVRLPYPGEAGERNNFRGDGYFDIDSGLNKSWNLRKYGSLKFAWEVYNVTNTVRFDPNDINGSLTSGTLGVASAELSSPRRMQFSLRYDF